MTKSAHSQRIAMTELETWYKEHGLCVRCGKPTRQGRVSCEACAARDSETKKLRAELRRKKGMCPQCGKLPITPGKKLCYACTGFNRDNSAIRRDEYRRKGLCIVCGQRPPAEGYATCEKCREYKAEWWRRKRGKRKAA